MRAPRILIGTHNRDKFKEIASMLSSFGLSAVSPADAGVECNVEENGKSYEENAIIKATAISHASGLLCIGEDSGLEVDALQGAPGLFSARWAGEPGNYEKNNERLLRELQKIPLAHRTARFICAMALVYLDRVLLICRGVCEGRIALSKRGTMGFGYDPLFEYPQTGKTFAEMGEGKHKVSHRANALAKFREEFLSKRSLIECYSSP